MKYLKTLAVLFIALWGPALSQGFAGVKSFNVLDYGAKGDGVTLDTAAIQKAIDAAAEAGTNVRVMVPRWRHYLVGTLVLRAGIDFHLNGELLASTNRADYIGAGVIVATNAADLKITGSGKISGRALEFMTGYDAADEGWFFKEWRPKMLALTGCTNLMVRDITLDDAPAGGLHLLGCQNVLIENVTVKSRLDVPDCDGIVPDHSSNVEIRGCHLTCGDDAIAIKSTRQTNGFGDCAHIRVHDCVIRTQAAGLKVGPETTGKIYDVLFEHCQILSSSRGLCIQLRDEGDVFGVTFRNLQFVSRYHGNAWWGRGEAISFTACQRNPGGKLGKLHDIRVENVSGKAENSVRINGSTASRVQNVELNNVAVAFSRWTKYPGAVYDNRPTKVLTPIEPHATVGFNLRHADRVTLDNCSVSWAGNSPDYFQRSVAAEGVVVLDISKFKGDSPAHPVSIK